MSDAPACENCARTEPNEADLVAVHRVYLQLDEWGEDEAKVTVVDDVERWCPSCRAVYPHQLLDGSA